MYKRLRKELNDIIPDRLNTCNLNYDIIQCDYYEINNHKPVVLHVINKKSNFVVMELTFPNDYPFKPPLITISPYLNPINYNKMIGNMSNNQKYQYEELFSALFFIIAFNPFYFNTALFSHLTQSNSCFCCSSISCLNNWNPALTIADLIKEYSLLINFKRFRKPYYLKLFNNLFYTDNYSIPEEIIIKILSFMGHPLDLSNISNLIYK